MAMRSSVARGVKRSFIYRSGGTRLQPRRPLRTRGASPARGLQVWQAGAPADGATLPLLLAQLHARLVAVGERDAGFFECALNRLEGARLQLFAGFQPGNG